MSWIKTNSLVSIIVVNWNRRELLRDCLCALSCQSYPDYEIIFVDNGSSDNSVALVKEDFPRVQIVALAENKGFTGGNSAGLKVAGGEFIALVNNDARTEREWLERLLQPMLDDPGIGSCAPKLVIEGTCTIDSAGSGLTSGGVGFNRGLKSNRDCFSLPERVFGPCGAAALYRATMLREIGFLDETFFLYDEDTDLGFRAQLAGWKCMYVPSAVVYHKGNATTGRLSDTHVYYHTRNLEFVWLKNMPLGLMVRFAHHKLIQEIGSFCYLCLRHRKWLIYFRAKWDALKMAPLMWCKRQEIQSKRRVSNRYIKSMMTPIFSRQLIRLKIQQFLWG